MKSWLRRLRGVIGMGITWAAGWALMGILMIPASRLVPGQFFQVFDAPPPALAVPGFVGGVLFALVVGIAGKRRRFSELSLPTFTAWGAVGGVLLSLVPVLLVGAGVASVSEGAPSPWRLTAIVGLPFTLMAAASAAATLLAARWADGQGLPAAADEELLTDAALEDPETHDEVGPGSMDLQTTVHAPREDAGVRHGDPGAWGVQLMLSPHALPRLRSAGDQREHAGAGTSRTLRHRLDGAGGMSKCITSSRTPSLVYSAIAGSSP